MQSVHTKTLAYYVLVGYTQFQFCTYVLWFRLIGERVSLLNSINGTIMFRISVPDQGDIELRIDFGAANTLLATILP